MNKFIKNLLSPTPLFIVLNVLCTVLFTTLSLISVIGEKSGVWCYIIYALTALSFGYTAYICVISVGKIRSRILNLCRKNDFLSGMIDDYGLRTVVFSTSSLVLNIAYSVLNLIVAIHNYSLWYFALAGYYTILTIMRGVVVTYYRKREKKIKTHFMRFDDSKEQMLLERRKYVLCGVLLVVLPVFLSIAVYHMVVYGTAFVYMGWTVYAFAVFAFYKITMAIINLVRAHKGEDLTIKALRKVSLADAMVTVLALQTTLLYTFGDGSGAIFNAITGSAVCLLTLILGITSLKKDIHYGKQ